MKWAVCRVKDHSGEIELKCKYCSGGFRSVNHKDDLYEPMDAQCDWNEREFYRREAAERGVILPYEFKPPEPKPIVSDAEREYRRTRPIGPVTVGLPPCTIKMKILNMAESMELAQKAMRSRGERQRLPFDGVGGHEPESTTMNREERMDLIDYERYTGGNKVRTRILYNANNKKTKILKRNGKENEHQGPRTEDIRARPILDPRNRKREQAGRVEKSHHLTLLADT